MKPKGYTELKLIGTPLQAGTLVVRGCIVESNMTIPHEFLSKSADEKTKLLVRDDQKLSKYSFQGLQEVAQGTETIEHIFHSIYIAPKLPLLRIKRTSLDFDNIMLFNGERSESAIFSAV